MKETEPEKPGMGVHDILFVLFKHRKKILLSAFSGIAAAAAVHFLTPPPYTSQVKLLVRYVLDRNTLDSLDPQLKSPGTGSFNENSLASEIEILTSWDLAEQVADLIDSEKSAQAIPGTAAKTDAAQNILRGLSVTALKGSNILLVSYKNQDPILAVQVLQNLVNRYFVKHLEVHRSASAFDYVSNETDQVRLRLKQIEDDLQKIKAKMGIISLAESTITLTTAMTKSEEALHTAQAEAAEQRARVRVMEGWLTTSGQSSGETPKIENDMAISHNYQALLAQIVRMGQSKQDLLSRFTPESRIVQLCKAQIETLEKEKKELENKYPGLVNLSPVANAVPRDAPLDIHTEKARLAAIEGKVETLQAQLAEFKSQTALLAEIGPQIAQLERKKEVEEANYKYFQNSLEKARIDEALDPTKMPNISVVQKPSPALRSTGDQKKLLLGLSAGGVILGLGLAFLIELEVDRSIKRPSELDAMRIHRMLTIPYLTSNGSSNGRSAPRNGVPKKGLSNSLNGKMPPWDEKHFIRHYCESLRDRLILHFHLNNMTRKPKLVAVTSCGRGAGTSTLAGGLAAALSETGDGKVLLVNMNLGHEELHPFIEGKHTASLAEAIQTGSRIPATSDNLYLAQAGSDQTGAARLIPKKFYEMMPHLKTCDFDYIIFDMPPLGESSTTLAMSGFMDKVLLIIEAEASQKDVIQLGYNELIAARANVSSVLNKSRNYGPRWMHDSI